jgi:hypothetical protein
VLAGQIGNFAGMSTLKPPLNLTALLRCGQIGNRLCPDPWLGPSAATSPQGFRFPVWEFSWPGAYQLENGRPAPLVRREPPVVETSSPYPLTYRLDFLATAGTLVLLAALVAFIPMSMAGLPIGDRRDVCEDRHTAWRRLGRSRSSFLISTVMNYSGMTSSARARKTGVPLSVLCGMARDDRRVPDRHDTAPTRGSGPLQATTARISGFDRFRQRDQRVGGSDGQDDQPAELVGRCGGRRRGRLRGGDPGARGLHYPLLTTLILWRSFRHRMTLMKLALGFQGSIRAGGRLLTPKDGDVARATPPP